jgi:hypothetical protein
VLGPERDQMPRASSNSNIFTARAAPRMISACLLAYITNLDCHCDFLRSACRQVVLTLCDMLWHRAVNTSTKRFRSAMTGKCRCVRRLLDLKLLSQLPRAGHVLSNALDRMFVSTLLACCGIGECFCTTSHRRRLKYGLLPVGCVVNILLIYRPASR